MIGTIRSKMQKSGAKIILWFTLLSLVGGSFFSLIRFSRRFKSDSVARVNDQQISLMEFKRKFAEAQHVVHEVRRIYGPQADMVLGLWGLNKNPDEYAMEALVSEKVIQSAADALKIQVNKEYVQAKLRDPLFVREHLGNLIPPQALSGGSLDITVLKYSLQKQGISEEQFDEMLVETMKRALLQRLIEGSLYIPQMALKEAYGREYLKKKFATLRLPLSEYIKKEKNTDEELEKYFDTHKEQYRIPEKRSARLWSFDADTYGVTTTDKDLENAYNKRKRTFIEKPEEFVIQHILVTFDPADSEKKVEARKKAQELLKQAKEKPEAFEALANKNSQSKDKGAAITIKRSGKEGMFERAVFALAPKEISPVVETAEGFEIIKLISKKEPVYKPLDKVKDTLIKSLKQEKFATEFNTTAQRVISQASDLPEVFTKFITERKGKESTLKDVTRDGSVQKERLFGLSKLGDKAFFEEEGKGFVIELTSIIPSALPALNSVKDKVVADLYKEKARNALEKDIQLVMTRVKDKKESLQEAAKSLSVKGEFSTTDWVNPQSADSLKKLEEKKLPVQKMFNLNSVHGTTQEITQEAGYVIELLEIEPFNQDDFEKKRDMIELQARQEESGHLQKSFIDALRARAKVDINTDLIRLGGRS